MALTRSEAIRAVWRSDIWAHASILALTDVIIEHDISEDSHHEVAGLRYAQKINFFAFRVRRAVQNLSGEKNRLLFFVDISYTKWADPDGDNYNAVIDGIEIVQELVLSELGSRWSETVGGSEPQAGPPNVSVTSIGEERVFRADFNYSGFICVAN